MTVSTRSGQNTAAAISGVVTNHGTLVIDAPAGGGSSDLVATGGATDELYNAGQLIGQSESGNPNYVEINVTNSTAGIMTLTSGTLVNE